jgi:hypothetical protein
MEAAQFEAFLKESGYAFESEKAQSATTFYFVDRGVKFSALSNDDNPDFFYVNARFDMPAPHPEPERVWKILRDLEYEYPVVKLRYPEGQQGNEYFEVAAEQFEADAAALKAIFWRTLDLIRNVAGECYRRLDAQPQKNDTSSGIAAYVAHLEEQLQRGCGPVSPAPRNGIEAIRPALAFALDPAGATGSAFCVGSTGDASFYVTNAHMVGDYREVTLYRQEPEFAKMTATVLAKGDPAVLDLALLSVPVARIQPAVLCALSPLQGQPVALAGYPRVLIWAADAFGELVPGEYVGAIVAVNHDGSSILHSAISRPGSSGGPIFDPASGHVFGVQRAGWEGEEAAVAVGRNALAQFLSDHGVSYVTGPDNVPAT